MLPPLIVERALALGLGLIAVTDHNTACNAGAVWRAAQGTGLAVWPGLEVQTREVLAKIDGLLASAGTDKSKLLSMNVYLSNIADFDAMNAAFDEWIDTANLPARATVEARLADPNLRVEITAVAALD